MLAIITQLQLPGFNRSTRSSGARKLTDNFFGFPAQPLRQVHRSESHDPSGSLVIRSETDVSSILFRELVLPLVPPDGHCDLQL